MRTNLILAVDSYKTSHYVQYPKEANAMFSYIESRWGMNERTLFFGLQMFLKEYLTQPILMRDIDEAEVFSKAHGVPFNREGWEYIYRKYNGFIPVTIKAVPEGLIIPQKNVLVTVQCDDPNVFWVASYIETMLVRAVWYPTTVATYSYECKKIIEKYVEMTSDVPEQINFKLHDFGGRGVSSSESAGIGGCAHMVNFMGSDTIEGVRYANEYYNCPMAGFSIPAAEHSTITSWGKENEVKAYENMLVQFAKPGSIVACVSDSYDIYNAVDNLWGKELRQKVIDSGATIVIRPDSGKPVEVCLYIVNSLANSFGYTTNSKGYKVLNNVRIIQGDGVNINEIGDILKSFADNGFASDNINFGMGGSLLQNLNRDSLGFAMKCSAIRIGEEWIDVLKKPVTDPKKNSKAGRITLYRDQDDNYYTDYKNGWQDDVLEVVYENGRLMKTYTLEEVRLNSNKK